MHLPSRYQREQMAPQCRRRAWPTLSLQSPVRAAAFGFLVVHHHQYRVVVTTSVYLYCLCLQKSLSLKRSRSPTDPVVKNLLLCAQTPIIPYRHSHCLAPAPPPPLSSTAYPAVFLPRHPDSLILMILHQTPPTPSITSTRLANTSRSPAPYSI